MQLLRKRLQTIPSEIRYLFKVYAFGIFIFTCLRFVLVIAQYEQLSNISFSLLLQAFLMGFRFDTVVSGYILALPALLNIINCVKIKPSIILFRISESLILLFYCIAFFISCVDVPYFAHYLTRITVSILHWTNSPLFMLKMVFEDKINYVFLSIFILLIYFTIKQVKKMRKLVLDKNTNEEQFTAKEFGRRMILSVFVLGFLFIGIRGRIALKSPIHWGTAFISNNNFINQLGLNPSFTFLNSYTNSLNPENQKIHFMDDQVAIRNVQKIYGISTDSMFASPIARRVEVSGPPLNANVVIVMMESMGLSKMKLDDCPISMTPYLDSLSKVSTTFTNVFSAGIHTFNGIYSTLFGMPALMNQQPMQATESINQPFTGIASTLAKFDYQTTFICPHDEQFDNMSGFLLSNGFQKIVGQKDFPLSEVHSTMGVPDDVLFEHVIQEISIMAKSPRPFLASVLTGSDHEPIYIPEGNGFVPKTKERKQQAVEYADWSINKFLKLASAQPWYSNTIFVFVADHGSWYRECYEMNISHHKIPLLLFSPRLIKPAMNNAVGGQIDVFPTIMGLLNRPYVNNTMGVDLLKEGRKYIAFSADDRLGCVNNDFFWYHNYAADNEYLLHYRNKDPNQYLHFFPQLKDTLETFAYSLLQTTQWMIDNKKVGPQEK